MSTVAIKKAFPGLPASFYDILGDRVQANGFTAQRLQDAVAHVIDNCQYPTPTVANFISFDRFVKTHTYEEIVAMSDKYGAGTWDSHRPIKLKDRPKLVWIHINDILLYNIKTEKNDY